MPLLFNNRRYALPGAACGDDRSRGSTHSIVWAALQLYCEEVQNAPEPEGLRISLENGTPIARNGVLQEPHTYIVSVPETSAVWTAEGQAWDMKLDMLKYVQYLEESCWPSSRREGTILSLKARTCTSPPRTSIPQGVHLHLPCALQAKAEPRLYGSFKTLAQQECLARIHLDFLVSEVPGLTPIQKELEWCGPIDERYKAWLAGLKEQAKAYFPVMQREQLVRHNLFGWGFSCVGLGASWEQYELAVFPSGETTADAYVMHKGWQADKASNATRQMKDNGMLVLVLDMDRTILHCTSTSKVSDLQNLLTKGEAMLYNPNEVLVPRAYLLDIVRMAYGLDRNPPIQRYEIMYCTAAGKSRAMRYLELLCAILLRQCQSGPERGCIEDATKPWRLTSTHCGGAVWKSKDVQDVVQAGFLTDEGNRMTVIIDDDPDAWDSRNRKQIVEISPQQGSASHATPKAFEKSAGQELRDFLCKVHERLTVPETSWTAAEVMDAVMKEHKYGRLSLCD